MKTLLAAFLICAGASAQPAAKYGTNPAAGRTFTHDGIQLYYETYGSGQPLLLIHGNGASISSFNAQIDFFRKRYRIIAMDSRDQGRSGASSGELTYEKMTDDLAALLDHLHSPPANVLGWSDGGIEALLLGIRHPEKVKKIAAMAANLYPEGATPEAIAMARLMLAAIPEAQKNTPQGKREIRLAHLLLEEPHIDPAALGKIQVPTLILAGDHDLISDAHTLEIYHHLAKAQLCIFPDATHMIPYDDPVRFNAAVARFLETPFVPKDRVKDVLKSIEAIERPKQ
jgi:pimeloyl-ACP methyl ester carboxylesterase